MKFFLDSEFIDDGVTIDLISIALVCENGAQYYAQSTEFDASNASPWVEDNVFSQLLTCINDAEHMMHLEKCDVLSCPWRTRYEIKSDILNFVAEQCNGEKPEFWANFADYDWVVFCQLFGRMIDLPQGWPKYCRDLKQLYDELGKDAEILPVQGDGEHNALEDARHDKAIWEALNAARRT